MSQDPDGAIDMTGEADQAFMSAEVEPSDFDPQEHYERLVEEYEEKGWDTSNLVDPSEGESDDPEPPPEDEAAEKAQDTTDYERADDALREAHEKSVQWKAGEENVDLSKAPGIWESQDEVPDFVLDTLEDIVRSGDVVWEGDYEKLPPSADVVIEQVLEDKLTQPQGWSLESLLDSLREELGDLGADVSDGYLLTVLRNETSAVLNEARERAYEEREEVLGDDREYVFDWVGPTDHRTTDTCKAIEEEIEDRGGAVPMEELREILYEKALEHADAEGTPERVDDWIPHWQCRRTFVRRVQSI